MKQFALVRVWISYLTGGEMSELVEVNNSRAALELSLEGEKNLDELEGDYAAYYVLSYDAAIKMVNGINSAAQARTAIWCSKMSYEPMTE